MQILVHIQIENQFCQNSKMHKIITIKFAKFWRKFRKIEILVKILARIFCKVVAKFYNFEKNQSNIQILVKIQIKKFYVKN